MEYRVFVLNSGLPGGRIPESEVISYMEALSLAAGESISIAGEEETPGAFPIVFAASGGTAAAFKGIYERCNAKRWIILNQGEGNALSASLQMATFLRERGAQFEILFGGAKEVAHRLKPYLGIMRALDELSGLRVGTIGKPSGWLIANDTDRAAMSSRFGLEFVDISLGELEDAFHENSYERNALSESILNKSFDETETQKALALYGAMKRVCKRHGLGAVTVRCFDLLSSIKTSGCIALALLNAEGVVAGCEGDMPSLVSMLLMQKLTGRPVFMCNPSRMDIEKNEMIFAHCTLPIDMADSFSLTTHFESDSSVAVRGELAPGPVTIFKLSYDGTRRFCSNGTLLDNPNESGYCRTQIRLRLDRPVTELLTNPVGNHFLVCRGTNAEWMDEFLRFVP